MGAMNGMITQREERKQWLSSAFFILEWESLVERREQGIAEAYDVLKSVGKLSNDELRQVFTEWNKGELLNFLIEITADIFGIKDDKGDGYLVDKVLDKTGMKGTGKWTVQQAADLPIAAPTIAASLDSRFLSGLKEERVQAAEVFKSGGLSDILSSEPVDKAKLIEDVREVVNGQICGGMSSEDISCYIYIYIYIDIYIEREREREVMMMLYS